MWRSVLRRLYPSIEKAPGIFQIIGKMNIAGALYSSPFAVIGLLALIGATDWNTIGALIPIGSGIFLVGLILLRFQFFIEFKLGKAGVPLNFAGALDSTLLWAAALVFGPSILWVAVGWAIEKAVVRLWRTRIAPPAIRTAYFWEVAQNLMFNIAGGTLTPLIGLSLYHALGGTVPRLDSGNLAPEFIATTFEAVIQTLMITPWLLYITLSNLFPKYDLQGTMTAIFLIVASFLQQTITDIFAILLAGLYVGFGLSIGIFGTFGLLVVSILSHISSYSAQRSRMRSTEMAQLEKMERAIIASSPDGSELHEVLAKYVPGLFSAQTEIRLFPDPAIPMESIFALESVDETLWEFARSLRKTQCYKLGTVAPWSNKRLTRGTIITPISDPANRETLGAIIVMLPFVAQRFIEELIPATESLADEIASALAGAANYRQAIQRQRQAQELEVGGRIQSGFLPTQLPTLEGWQLAAALDPARETSGDFYDVIDLGDGCYGLCVADVSDKGVGAALYMALSRTLIRTYATEFKSSPAKVIAGVNRRILADTSAGLFVTVFYAILDTVSGRLTYANAGHNPAFLLNPEKEIRPLGKTGIPLGMFEEAEWNEITLKLESGERLFIYTDGVTDAENTSGEMYGETRLIRFLLNSAEQPSANAVQECLQTLIAFMAGKIQFDDITMLMLTRETEPVGVT